MNGIKLYTDEYDPGVTLLSNVFVDVYMKDANDAQIKIYLFLIRNIKSNKPFTISGVADEFNYTEKEVMRSLSYWEEKQVISLEYDGNGAVVGIELRELSQSSFVSAPVTNLYAFPVRKENYVQTPAETEKNKVHSFTPTQLLEMASDPDWVSIKSIAESYFGRTLSAQDIQSLAHIYKDLNFTPIEVDKLIEECLTNDRKTMRSIRNTADRQYADTKITPNVKAVLNALGEDSMPSPAELEYINRWLKDMNLELVLEGCKKASVSTGSNRIKYADGIFRNWKSQNISSIEDMAANEESYRRSKDSSKKKTSTNKFNQFPQTQYDFTQLERELEMN